MGKKSHSQKFFEVFSKNYYRMLKLFWSTPELLHPEIDEIRRKFNIRDLSPVDPTKEKDGERLIKAGQNKLGDFLKKNEAELPWIYERLRLIRKRLKLGREWNKTFLVYIVSGITFPPTRSVYIEVNDLEGIIIFEINKDTTKSDIDLAWKNIEQNRKRLFEKIRSSFPSEAAIKNLIDDINAKIIRFEKPYRSDSQERKYKTTDMDLVGELFADEEDWSEEADKKRANKLRVNKNRLKKI